MWCGAGKWDIELRLHTLQEGKATTHGCWVVNLFPLTFLVGGLEHFSFSIYIYIYILGIIIPTDELIFFRGVGIPPTSFHFLYSPESWMMWNNSKLPAIRIAVQRSNKAKAPRSASWSCFDAAWATTHLFSSLADKHPELHWNPLKSSSLVMIQTLELLDMDDMVIFQLPCLITIEYRFTFNVCILCEWGGGVGGGPCPQSCYQLLFQWTPEHVDYFYSSWLLSKLGEWYYELAANSDVGWKLEEKTSL